MNAIDEAAQNPDIGLSFICRYGTIEAWEAKRFDIATVIESYESLIGREISDEEAVHRLMSIRRCKEHLDAQAAPRTAPEDVIPDQFADRITPDQKLNVLPATL